MRIEHWDVAFNHGKTAALNMLGQDVPHMEVPYFFSELGDWGQLHTSARLTIGTRRSCAAPTRRRASPISTEGRAVQAALRSGARTIGPRAAADRGLRGLSEAPTRRWGCSLRAWRRLRPGRRDNPAAADRSRRAPAVVTGDVYKLITS